MKNFTFCVLKKANAMWVTTCYDLYTMAQMLRTFSKMIIPNIHISRQKCETYGK